MEKNICCTWIIKKNIGPKSVWWRQMDLQSHLLEEMHVMSLQHTCESLLNLTKYMSDDSFEENFAEIDLVIMRIIAMSRGRGFDFDRTPKTRLKVVGELETILQTSKNKKT